MTVKLTVLKILYELAHSSINFS